MTLVVPNMKKKVKLLATGLDEVLLPAVPSDL